MATQQTLNTIHSSRPQFEHLGITGLSLVHFRNVFQVDYQIVAPIVILIGPNGVGKTNILEALSLFAPGRGLHSAKLSQMGNAHSQKPWTVAASLETGEGPITIGTALDISPSGTERRLIRINQTPLKSQASFSEWLNIVWVIPAMAQLFNGPGSDRRKFLDRMAVVIDPTHNERLNRYEHFLRERSLLLRHALRGDPLDTVWLDTLEQRLAADGIAITYIRLQTAKQLTQMQPKDENSPFPRFCADMQGDVEIWCKTLSALEAEEKMIHHLKESRSLDAQTGGSAFGPHRGDLHVEHLGKHMPANLCSTGEQKMLLLALTLAFIHLLAKDRDPPTLLLLDDVVAHLDESHRLYLFQELNQRIAQGIPLQIWMTGTHRRDFSGINMNVPNHPIQTVEI
jgi:DNA replication and repair protein RecF